MLTRTTAAPLRIPDVSYGPLRLLEAVPWLMLAAAMRTFMSLAAMIVASLCLFLAFLLAARRMIEFTDGQTGLDKFDFGSQLGLARRVLFKILVLLVTVPLAAYALGARAIAPHLLLGFDGIAFDQFSKIGMLWSCVLAAIVLIMVVNAGQGQPVRLFATLGEFAARWRWLVPAILAATALQFGLNFVQGGVRGPLLIWWKTALEPQAFKNLVYFFFIFCFAAIRLWATLSVLTFALRQSYRHAEA